MEDEADRVSVEDVDLLDDEEVVRARLHLGTAAGVVGVLPAPGAELFPAVKPDPAAQAEDVLGGRPLLPPLGELGLGLERLVHPDQVLVDQGLPLLPDVEPLHVWLQVRWERGARIRQGPTLWLGPGAAGEREREPRRAGEEIAPPQASRARVVHGRSPRHTSGRSHCVKMPGFVRQGHGSTGRSTCSRSHWTRARSTVAVKTPGRRASSRISSGLQTIACPPPPGRMLRLVAGVLRVSVARAPRGGGPLVGKSGVPKPAGRGGVDAALKAQARARARTSTPPR